MLFDLKLAQNIGLRRGQDVLGARDDLVGDGARGPGGGKRTGGDEILDEAVERGIARDGGVGRWLAARSQGPQQGVGLGLLEWRVGVAEAARDLVEQRVGGGVLVEILIEPEALLAEQETKAVFHVVFRLAREGGHFEGVVDATQALRPGGAQSVEVAHVSLGEEVLEPVEFVEAELEPAKKTAVAGVEV